MNEVMLREQFVESTPLEEEVREGLRSVGYE